MTGEWAQKSKSRWREVAVRLDIAAVPGPSGCQSAHFPTFPLDHLGNMGDTTDMSRRGSLTKNTDSKGRITLGDAFANRTMLVERHGEEIILRLARVIPERESWLYENETALASVRRGLKQAKAGKFVKKGPDLRGVAALADQLEGD